MLDGKSTRSGHHQCGGYKLGVVGVARIAREAV
jgi:hypothetical protein